MARSNYFNVRNASFRAMAPGFVGFQGFSFLHGGMIAAAPWAVIASWHLWV